MDLGGDVSRASDSSFRRAFAVHLHWKSFLLLSNTDDRVVHETYNIRGTYRISGRVLSIAWERFAPDDFLDVDGTYTHLSLVADLGNPEVHSFDIFDTLLARRCVEPRNIFYAVERKSNRPGFAELRIRSEASLYAQGDYTLDDIYRRMVVGGGLSEDDSLILKTMELEEEYANLIPVTQHIKEVRPGDILISDMYLPKTFVARLVRDKCGLQTNAIYLSSHGKSSGAAWDELSRHFRIGMHTGDNAHSDIKMSESRGIPAMHTTVTAMTAHERLVESLGYRGLARAIREARLAFWHGDADILLAGRAQIEVNVPVLFLTALRILFLARSTGYKNILFSSRDCYLLLSVFRSLVRRLGDDLRSEYFLTSRIARASPSAAYLSYLHHLSHGGRTLVVDLCGTGWSLTRLMEIADRPDIDIFLMHFIKNHALMSSYRSLGDIKREPNPLFVTERGNNEMLEALNTASHEMVTDIVQVQDLYVPRFVKQQSAPRVYEIVSWAEHAVSLTITCMDKIDSAELDHYVESVKNSDIEVCYSAFDSVTDAVPEVRHRNMSENKYLTDAIQRQTAARAAKT